MWKNIIGEERVKRIIRQSLESGKLPNAYLFTGAEGLGKDAMAIEVAKALNCLNPINGAEACDECTNCKQIASLGSPLLQFIVARAKETTKSDDLDDDDDGKDVEIVREQFALKANDPYHNIQIPNAQMINVKQIRRLRMLLSRSMTGGNKRVLIISEADMMNQQSQNAFLKSLEEPHDNTLIILTSSNPSRLYATILSRCQDVRFDLLEPAEIADALVERDDLDRKQAEFLARLSGGSFSVARGLVNEDVAVLRNQVVQLLRMGLSQSRKNALTEIDNFLPRAGGGSFLEKRHTVEQLLHLLTLWLRDALAISSGSEEYIFNNDQLDDLKRFTSRFGVPLNIVKALRAVEIAQRNVRLQLQLRPVVLQMVIEMEAALITG
jgi:DNA polymerase-3 subunit delta'